MARRTYHSKGKHREYSSRQYDPEPTSRLEKLNRLLPYYLECVREDSHQGARNFLTDDGERFFVPPIEKEWSLADQPSVTLTFDSSKLLKSLRQQGQTAALFYGYPLFVEWITKSQTGWSGGFAIPVFLVPIEHTQLGRTLEIRLTGEEPRVNGEFLDRVFRSTDERRAFLHDIGLTDSDSDDAPRNLSALARRLAELDVAPQVENVNPESIESGSVAGLSKEGLYNRHIVVLGERTKFTVGLEYELGVLSKDAQASAAASTALTSLFGDSDSDDHVFNEAVDGGEIIEVVSLNDEQRAAVRSSFENRLTVVTGPPGTGKSQVVTTVLANAYLKGQRVLFTSRNNKAVDVVEARLNGLSQHPLIVRLGRRSGERDLRAELGQFLTSLLSVSTTQEDTQNHKVASDRFAALSKRRAQLWKQVETTRLARNKVDQLDKTLDALSEPLNDEVVRRLRDYRGPASDIPVDVKSIVSRYARPSTGLFAGISRFFRQKRDARQLLDQVDSFRTDPGLFGDLPAFAPTSEAEWRQWDVALDDLEDRCDFIRTAAEFREAFEILKSAESIEGAALELADIEEKIWDCGTDLISTYGRLLPSRLDARIRRAVGEFRAILERLSGDVLGGQAYAQIMREQERLFKSITAVLPIWCVTNLSARGTLPFEPDIFDLVVIDEASQCDIPSALPLLYRAKRAMIIGDPQQLRHISTMDRHRAQTIEAKYHLTAGSDQPYTYVNNSLFDLAATCAGDAKVVTLREHFRSHGDIVQFSNRMWYRGALKVCTDYRRLRKVGQGGPGITWTDVTGAGRRPSGGGVVYQDEAKKVVDVLSDLLVARRFSGSVGVVTPFRAQANRIRDLVNERLDLSVMDSSDLIVDTAHGFQGDERDVIIFSPCVGADMPRGAKYFLSSTGNLFNVAITRARSLLHVVGDRAACATCGIKHIEDFAKYVASLGDDNPRENVGPTSWDNPGIGPWERPFFDALAAAGIKTMPQYKVNQYRLDLAFIGDETNKIDIEVDGEHYHRDWDGSRCREDVVRDMRLTSLGWRVKRFWVYRLRDEMNECVREVLAIATST